MADSIMTFRCVFLATVCLSTIASASAENWPGWRGPRGDGTSRARNVPTHWDGASGRNVAWKVAIPGTGHSSPIVWGDAVFVVTCVADEARSRRQLIKLSRAGKIEWQRTVITAPLESKHQLNSYASGTPVTDGQTVYVAFLEVGDKKVPALNVSKARDITFGQMVIAAYDFSGNQKWIARPGDFASCHGFCSCPVIHNNLLIVNGDHDGDSYVVALDRKSGRTVWKTPREHRPRSYVTPLIRDVAGKTQMVFSGSKRVVSLDPATGRPHWMIDGPTEQFVASVVFDGTHFFATGGFPTHHVVAIRPDGAGNVTETHVSWHAKNVRCYVPSPVLVGQQLFVADDRGTASCFDTTNGKRVWQSRLGRHFSASLTAVDGLVYFIADDGVTKIVRAGDSADIVAENELGEWIYASPALVDGRIYLRGEKHLFAIGRPTQSANRTLPAPSSSR